jgi:hypothetical protein
MKKEAFSQTGLVEIVLLASIQFRGEKRDCACKSLSSVIFEPGSRLPSMASEAFRGIGLIAIMIHVLIEFLADRFFDERISLSAVVCESGSRFSQIETGQSVELAWFKLFVLHRLKSSVEIVGIAEACAGVITFVDAQVPVICLWATKIEKSYRVKCWSQRFEHREIRHLTDRHADGSSAFPFLDTLSRRWATRDNPSSACVIYQYYLIFSTIHSCSPVISSRFQPSPLVAKSDTPIVSFCHFA